MSNQKKRIFWSLMMSLMIFFSAYAQKVNISGVITSNVDGEPIIGVTVMEKGTSNGTMTDFDGKFSLQTAKGAQLLISYVGYVTQTLSASANMKIVLEEDLKTLEEFVVTGYTVQRKVDLSGAVSVMNMKNPVSESNPNMLSSMQGKLAGVQIVGDAAPGGESTSIRVRGMSTINGNDPLYIIDGVATTENLSSLNSSDIESIQVLKDAASASIYGSRAANGVIIITTKGGKGDKLKVDVGYSMSVQMVKDSYDMMNAKQWLGAFWQAHKNDDANWTPSLNDYPFLGSTTSPIYGEYFDAAKTIRVSDTDWQDEVYSPAWSHNVNASVSNSGEKGSMLLSANYVNQDGLMDYTYYRRFSARLNSTYKISKYVNVGENLMVAKWLNRGFGTQDDRGIPYTAMRMNPAIPVYNESGAYASPMTAMSSDVANPVKTLANGKDNNNESWRIFGNAYLEVLPVKGLTLKSNIGIEHTQFFNRTLSRKVEASDVNSVTSAYGQGDTWTWTNTANYNGEWGKHHLNALLGSEAIEYIYKDLSGTRKDFAFEDDNYMYLGAGGGTQTNAGGMSDWALFSLFGKIDYNYGDRYLLSATVRRDATSRLYTDNNSGVFPAFSGAWRFSEEAFVEKPEWFSNGKVRVAWGQNGNSAISNNYAYYSTYVYNSGAGAYDLYGTNTGTVTGITVATSGNKDLKWETTTQTNVGLDLGFLDNALTVSADYYVKKTKDMLTVPPVLTVAGENASMWMNTGDMKNTGWEITADYRSKSYGDFSFGVNLNISQYKNKVVKLNDAVHSIIGDVSLIEGEAMGVYYGYIADGLFQSEEEAYNHAYQQGAGAGRIKYRDINTDGVIDEKDRCIIGDPNPDFSAGLNLDLNWKGFTLSAFFTGEFGFDIYNQTRKQLDFMSYGDASLNHGTNLLSAWTPENTTTSVPALSYSDNNNETRMSTYFVEDGSYVKMKYLKLNYNIPERLCSKCFAKNISVYGQIENLFTITDYSGLDPELPLSTYGSRVDNGAYPIARSYSLGVNVTF